MKSRGANSLQLSLIYFITLLQPFLLISETTAAHEECPWFQNDAEVPDEVKSHCICATNPSSNNQLSVQCQEVDAQQLVSILLEYEAGTNQPLELLYLNGSRITDSTGMIPSRLFGDLKVISLQLSSCGIQSIHPETFLGLETHIKHLSLSQNHITEVPKGSLEKLHRLALLDLSYNKITRIPQGAFEKLTKLHTLKLNDNNLELESDSFKGLEGTLRNLNLKGTRISSIPDAISNLSSLAFLDLAQNRLRDLESSQFLRLHSLAALNLERNLLQTLPDTVFHGVNDTLSSLSLLNNLITHFPQAALHTLKELRVLDLGFNLLTEIPSDAFDGLTSLTLLALDGNPLASLSQDSFSSLNTTLKGISLGGRFLNCDCRIRWISEWIKKFDLQVTSRERNPQFCGSPPSLRTRNFYQIKPDDLLCNANTTSPQGDYDVDLSPEDIALLGLGSSPLFVTQPGHQSEEDTASEQDTDENKTTFVLQAPQTNQRNFTRTTTRHRLRRPRPTKPPLGDRVPAKTSNEDKDLSLEKESEENDGGEENSSLDISFLESSVTNRTSNSSSSSLKSTSTSTPTISTTKSTTRKAPLAIRPHNIRPKFTPKSSYTTVTSTVSNTASATKAVEPESTRPSFTKSTSTTTSKTYAATPGQPNERKHASKTIDAMDIDDSKIPVISGVGSSLSNSNLNSGNIMAVKPPTSVQTHGGVAVKPQNSINTPPSSASHQGPQAVRPMTPNLIFAEKSDILLREVERTGDSLLLHWESSKHSSGFRIIYRLFGEDTFRHGPPLAATEREYRIKNIPHNECLVVCVVPYDDILYNEINPSAASVPPGSQCREVKPDSPSALMNHMDKITIGASAAICATVLIAVLIFIWITKRSKTKRPNSNLMAKVPPSMMTPSPGPAMMTPGPFSISKEWDQMSVISTKSIPRARVYHGSMDGLANNVAPRASMIAPHVHRQVPDGHSTNRSYLSTHHHHHNHSMHGYNGHSHVHHNSNAAAAVSSYLNNQGRLLRTSLGSRASYDALNKMASSAHSHRQFEQNNKRRRPGRLSQSESLNTLNGYETPDNWTDHDMDFYVARNPTRHDLVQL